MPQPDSPEQPTLEKQLADTLDQSIATLDKQTLLQLKSAREQALTSTTAAGKRSWQMMVVPAGMAVAACLALIIVAPTFMQTDAPDKTLDNTQKDSPNIAQNDSGIGAVNIDTVNTGTAKIHIENPEKNNLATTAFDTTTLDTTMAYLDEDPEFLMTLEMLEILGEPSDAS